MIVTAAPPKSPDFVDFVNGVQYPGEVLGAVADEAVDVAKRVYRLYHPLQAAMRPLGPLELELILHQRRVLDHPRDSFQQLSVVLGELVS